MKPVEATFCGFIPLVEAEMSFMDCFTSEASQKDPSTASLEAIHETVPRSPNQQMRHMLKNLELQRQILQL